MNATEYVYVLSGDYTLQPKHREKLDHIVQETGLSNEAAQKIIDLHVEITEEYSTAICLAYEEAIKNIKKIVVAGMVVTAIVVFALLN